MEINLPKYFPGNVVSIICYVMNCVLKRTILKLSSYKIYKERKTNNKKDNIGKLDAKVDKGLFLEYSPSNKALWFFIKWTLTIEESIHISFDETNLKSIEVDVFIV